MHSIKSMNGNTTEGKNEMEKNFLAAIETWMEKAQEIITEGHKRNNFSFECAKLEIEEGRRYMRIVRVSLGSRSAHCFIDKTDGNVYKPANYKSPIKNFSRGNIYTNQIGVSEYGAIRF